MGNKVPWKFGMLFHLPATSRPLIFPQKEAFLSPCNFATTHLTASILNFYLPLTSRPTKWRTPSQKTPHFVRSNCWGPVTSENKCVGAPKPCIMRSFGLKMRQKQVRETFRKVCQTCFCAIIAVCRRDF